MSLSFHHALKKPSSLPSTHMLMSGRIYFNMHFDASKRTKVLRCYEKVLRSRGIKVPSLHWMVLKKKSRTIMTEVFLWSRASPNVPEFLRTHWDSFNQWWQNPQFQESPQGIWKYFWLYSVKKFSSFFFCRMSAHRMIDDSLIRERTPKLNPNSRK